MDKTLLDPEFQLPIEPPITLSPFPTFFYLLALINIEQLSSFAGTALTKCHTLGGLDNKCSFSHSFGGWKFLIKVPVDLVSGLGSLHGFVDGVYVLT